ncbi:MAG: hypothetical protein V7459_11545 [Oceanicoccus sp.]
MARFNGRGIGETNTLFVATLPYSSGVPHCLIAAEAAAEILSGAIKRRISVSTSPEQEGDENVSETEHAFIKKYAPTLNSPTLLNLPNFIR